MSSITLLVADDHTVIRSGICALLRNEPDFNIIGEAKSGREAVLLARQLSPNVLIMDLAMPLLNGAEATRQVTRECPDTKVIILSSYQDDVHIEASMSSGAAAYLLKATAASEIIDAVREVNKGSAYFSPAVAERLRAQSLSKLGAHKQDALKLLSTREAEVFQLIAEGFSNKQIAGELNISIKTVEKHRQSLMGKLDIHCIAGLTRHAARNGIIETLSSREVLSPAR
ncbi:MAG TPA: response regulator transcription factor [Candidatus Angelobacter sp.]|nr:response regulator transcription factor [Candidatus Angelobacter sp.]